MDRMIDPTVRAQAERWMDLIEAAARDFAFPEPPSTVASSAEAGSYLRRLIEHVEDRDFARAFELRIGVRQADWTPDQVQQFATWLRKKPYRDPDKFSQPLSAFTVARHRVTAPIDDAALRHFVDGTMTHMVMMRTSEPTSELPLFVAGLLTTGELLTTTVSRADRIAFVTMLARTQPLFGWLVASDMFIHQIAVGGKASKVDAIGVHYGTRTTRGFRLREYAVVAGALQWKDVRDDVFGTEFAKVEDPYAFIFTPPTSGAPS